MRVRILVLSSLVVAVVATIVATRMRGDAGAPNEERLLLDRYEGLDVEDPLAERARRVEGIESLPLTEGEAADRIRDLCVAAHRALIVAEEQGSAARAAFERATRGGDERELAVEEQARIEASLSQSNEALGRARESMPRCLDEIERLERRLHRPHAR